MRGKSPRENVSLIIGRQGKIEATHRCGGCEKGLMGQRPLRIIIRTGTLEQINATDRQIDLLVYELYGLTEEKIKIVKGG